MRIVAKPGWVITAILERKPTLPLKIIKLGLSLKNSVLQSSSVAEQSKVLDLGSSLFRVMGSNFTNARPEVFL